MQSKINKFGLLLIFFLSLSGIQAQNMYVKPLLGNQTSYSVANIQKITFNNGSLLVNPISTSQTVGTHSISENRFISFTQFTNNTPAPIAYDQTFCNMSVTLADLIAIGNAIKWYDSPTGGTALATTTVLTNGTYYATQTQDNYESLVRTAVFVTINPPAPTAPSIENFCGLYNPTVADFAGLGTVTSGTNIKWYSTASGGTALADSTPLSPGTTYYATQTLNGCESATRTAVLFLNTIAPNKPLVSNQTVCFGTTISNLSAIGTNIDWYATSGGGGIIPQPLAITTPVTTGVYYATQTVGDCTSDFSNPVTITVNYTPPPTASAQTFSNAATVANLTANGSALKWYTSPTGGSALATSSLLVTGTYYVTQTLNNCESARTSVSVTVPALAVTEQHLEQSFCLYPNPVKNVLNLSGIKLGQLINSIEIISLEGQLILQQKQINNSAPQINVSLLPHGIYICKIICENETQTIKFLKQ